MNTHVYIEFVLSVVVRVECMHGGDKIAVRQRPENIERDDISLVVSFVKSHTQFAFEMYGVSAQGPCHGFLEASTVHMSRRRRQSANKT